MKLVLAVFADGKPKSHRDVVLATRLNSNAANNTLRRCWERGLLLRTKEPFYEAGRTFHGRAGVSSNTRPYHLYVLKPKEHDTLVINGNEFVKYSKRYLDARGGGSKSKAQIVLEFLKEHNDKAFFSIEVAEALKDAGVVSRDVMMAVRRFEREGLVYVRGYRTDARDTPFKEGYLITWKDKEKPNEQAIEEAIQRTNSALESRASTNPLVQRVHAIRNMVIESSKLKEIVSFTYIHNKLDCTEVEAEGAIARTLQLYPDLRGIKLFGVYRYFYHSSLSELDLKAAIAMKENYIRVWKGRDNRIGHNWEAVPEWFIDKFTTGAKFWAQNHRNEGMDSRRITLYLVKSVGGRKQAAEVDRVWEVTPGVFSQPITYVLSCKWAVVRKRDIEDFFEVLRWSKEFGVDTPDGRQVKQGVNGVFAGSSFDPREKVRLKDETTLSLASYASRMNIQILKAADFNEQLHKKGCPTSVTVQKICKIAKDEGEVRRLLEAIWEKPLDSEKIISEAYKKNEDIYKFEEILKSSSL